MLRYGMPPKPSVRYRWRPGAYAMILRGDEILLTKTLSWQLPGGGVDPGETELAALHRETLEETGWQITGARFLTRYESFRWLPDYKFWARKLCAIYVAAPLIKVAAPTEPGHSAHWVPLREAPALIASDGDAACVAGFMAGHAFQRARRKAW